MTMRSMRAWLVGACAVAGAAALMVGAPEARAGSCGGGGGGGDGGGGGSSGGGSDGGGGGGSSSDYSPDYSAQPSCVESSDILGYRECTGFGTWGTIAVFPHLTVEVGSSIRTLSLSRLSLSGSIDHDVEGSYSYRMVEGDLAAEAVTAGADMRLLWGKRVYLGLEGQLAGVSADEDAMAFSGPAVDMPGATLDARIKMALGGGGVAGVRTRLGSVSLGGELFAGARSVMVELESRLGFCETTEYAYDTHALVEARARLDWWISPWTTLGAFVGHDLLAPEHRAFGVTLGGHVRAFDGIH